MSIYGSGIYGSGTYGLTLDDVTSFTITASASDQLNLSWINPAYPGFYGILILRREGSAITDDPVNGTPYSEDELIGNSKVVYVGDNSQNVFPESTTYFTDVVYYYKIFTFNNIYNYSIDGVPSFSSPIDITSPSPPTDFDVQDIGVDNTLYLSWVNPTNFDFSGVRIVRKLGGFPTSIMDGTIIYDGSPITELYDTSIDNFTLYFYAIFAFDEVPLYSLPAFDYTQCNPLLKRFKFIKDKVTDFQAVVDKEQTIFYWEPINRTLNLKAFRVNGNEISLTSTVTVGDPLPPYNTFVSSVSGLSSVDNKYLNDEIIFLSKYNIISRPKRITSYNGTSKVFSIENAEYIMEPLSIFGFKNIDVLIDDPTIYIDSTLTVGSSAHKVTTFDTSSKTFMVSGSPAIVAGDKFTLSVTYYPKLYISDDNGKTYDNGTNLIYSVSNTPIPLSIESSYYYNKFKDANSSLLNTTDSTFYVGAYVTFITGNNKGYSRKVLSFNVNTREFTTEYFNYTIAQDDVFTVNRYNIPLVSNIEDYVFKMVLWNNDEANSIYSEEAITYPSLSLQNYLNTLDNGYWDTSAGTNLYKIVHGIAKEAHSRAENEIKFQKTDFSIKKVREIKLGQNFGNNFDLDRDPNLSLLQYRKRLEDTIRAFRNTSLHEGLNQLSAAFNKMPLHYESLSSFGWRIGDDSRSGKRLGYKLDIVPRTVLTGDSSTPYTTFTTYVTGASGSLSEIPDYYKDSYITFTSYPSGGETFDQTVFGDFLLVDTYSSRGGISTFTIVGSGLGTSIPNGADFLILTSNEGTAYGTIPYSDVIAMFGAKIYIYGPFLSAADKSKLEELIDKIVPAHVKKIISYETKFVGDSSHFQFEGEKTNLKNDCSLNILRPIKAQLLEAGRLEDTFTTSVTGTPTTEVFNGINYSSFVGVNLTTKHNYYKDKYIKFLTGANAGLSKKVIDYVGGTSNFITEEFPYTISEGDDFELEKINYQTKYITQIIDVTPDVYNVNFFDNKFVGGWFVRKSKDDIEEKAFIQFSDDMIDYTIPRELKQNEKLAELKVLNVSTVTDTTTFTTAITGSRNAITRTDNYYKNSYIRFLTGLNKGIYKKIVSYDADTLQFITEPFAYTITVNDKFQLLKTDMKRFAKIRLYNDNLSEEDDIEIESLVIKIK